MKKKLFTLLLAAITAITCTSGVIASDEAVLNTEENKTAADNFLNYPDGVYRGSAEGFNYDSIIIVDVTIKDGRITNVDVVSSKDDAPFMNDAVSVTGTIISSQSTDVDAVSGATISSQGIINAVKDALYNHCICDSPALVTVLGKTATCTEPGLTDGTKCSACGKIFLEQEEIPALGHEIKITTKRATPKSKGYRKKICSRCGEQISKTAVNVNIRMFKKWKIKMYIFQQLLLGSCFHKGPLFFQAV